MIGLNLHKVVRGVITSVHPDEECTLYQSVGQVNVKGIVKSKYSEPQSVKVNFQPLDTQALQHLERVGDTKASEQIFLYSDMVMPISAGQRQPLLRSGDFIKRIDGTWWLITSVIEDWTRDGWANAGISQQITAPDFSASDWSKGDTNV